MCLSKGGCGERGRGCGKHPPDPETNTPLPDPEADTSLDPEADTPVETATEAGGTHPTGMHSCIQLILIVISSIQEQPPFSKQFRDLSEFDFFPASFHKQVYP